MTITAPIAPATLKITAIMPIIPPALMMYKESVLVLELELELELELLSYGFSVVAIPIATPITPKPKQIKIANFKTIKRL